MGSEVDVVEDVVVQTSVHSTPTGHGVQPEGGGGELNDNVRMIPQMPPSKWNDWNVR